MLQNERRETGLQFVTHSLWLFLWIGATFPFFHSDGKTPCVNQDLKLILWGLQMDLSHNLSMRILIISSPWALLERSLLMMFLISFTDKSTSESDFSVTKGKSDGNVLPLSINEHSFAKKELNISLFSLKSVTNLLSWKVVECRVFFYYLKESLIRSNTI